MFVWPQRHGERFNLEEWGGACFTQGSLIFTSQNPLASARTPGTQGSNERKLPAASSSRSVSAKYVPFMWTRRVSVVWGLVNWNSVSVSGVYCGATYVFHDERHTRISLIRVGDYCFSHTPKCSKKHDAANRWISKKLQWNPLGTEKLISRPISIRNTSTWEIHL